jgi:hypothetical protein
MASSLLIDTATMSYYMPFHFLYPPITIGSLVINSLHIKNATKEKLKLYNSTLFGPREKWSRGGQNATRNPKMKIKFIEAMKLLMSFVEFMAQINALNRHKLSV